MRPDSEFHPIVPDQQVSGIVAAGPAPAAVRKVTGHEMVEHQIRGTSVLGDLADLLDRSMRAK